MDCESIKRRNEEEKQNELFIKLKQQLGESYPHMYRSGTNCVILCSCIFAQQSYNNESDNNRRMCGCLMIKLDECALMSELQESYDEFKEKRPLNSYMESTRLDAIEKDRLFALQFNADADYASSLN